MKTTLTLLALCLILAVAGCGDDSGDSGDGTSASVPAQSGEEAESRTKPRVTVPKGKAPAELIEEDLIEGTGATAENGDEVTVQYVGVGFDSQEEFDASWNTGEPFTFTLGEGKVILGWERGLEGMKVGGRRQLVIPAPMAYGAAGFPPKIRPNEALVFVIDLLKAE
jgi:peptidylprolyl isomerase